MKKKKKMVKSYWSSVFTSGPKSQAAIKRWFAPLCDDMRVESAKLLCDVETDREKKISAVMIDQKGKRRVATRTLGRTYQITLKPASPSESIS